MRHVIGSVLVVGVCCSAMLTAQTAGGSASGKPAIKACTLLPKDLVMKVSGAVNKAVFELPPSEEPAGKSGSACNYADITLQIDAFTPEFIDSMAKMKARGAGSSRAANWVPVPDVGDRAYFNADAHFAELMGYAGGHTFTIQMGVPFDSTAEKVKPNAIALAQAIVPKLK